MLTPSNLYAEKIFLEHPDTLWALDDQADYISLISEEDRNISTWNDSSGESLGLSAVTVTSVLDEPFPESYVTKVIGDVPSGVLGQVVCISPDIINFNELDSELATFSVGSYINSLSSYISGIEIGYEYTDTFTGEKIQNLKQYSTSISNSWIFVSETFEVIPQNTSIRIVIKINYIGGGTSSQDYEFLINGVTLGQWSEEFNSTSLGVNKSAIPSTISGDYSGRFGIPAVAYGLQDNNGYYLVSQNKLDAKNTGIPMVYGASGLTTLIPNNNRPSLMVPGSGFLNEEGKYKDLTLEMWLRINSDATQQKRIVGPINSLDGLYVDGPFLTLRVSDNFESYYVGEWTRPMLVHIKTTNNNATVLINGEEVISIDYETSSTTFPSKLDDDGKDQDWIGFYSYEDVSPVDIDCVAIYSYDVPAIVAKRRFVYGQGVEFPENINQAYSGSSIYVDYPFSEYSNNYSYPDLGNWNQGIVDNLSIEANTLSTPDYQLPDIILSNSSELELYKANKLVQNESDIFFTFRPNSGWNNIEGYLAFDNLDIINNRVRSFYGIFKVKELKNTDQVLFYIESSNTTNNFSITLNQGTITYKLNYSGTEQVIYESYLVTVGEQFSVAIDIDVFSLHFGQNVASFFGNPSSLKLYVGGKKELSNTFIGNIYSVGFSNDKNHEKISSLFNEIGVSRDYENVFDLYSNLNFYDAGSSYFGSYSIDGGITQETFDKDFWEYVIDGGSPTSYVPSRLIDHIGSYSLMPYLEYGAYGLDIGANSSWEDYIPLTYFSKFVTDEYGDEYYDLDFIQFNINYPAPSKFLEEESVGSWTYEELQAAYSSPVQRTYASLDNQLFTGYLDYEDLKNKSVKNYKYDTSESLVRSYVSFQFVESGANATSNYFTKTELPPKDSVVEPGNDWMTTKYEVVDNMIIYPPVNSDVQSLAIVTHLDFNVRGIIKNKINIKSLEYASQSFNESSPNAIGTRFGTKIYPYKKSGVYFNYKDKNPFVIYKGSSPYLYLTRHSGLELKGKYDPLVTRGLSIPINETFAENYKVLAMQTAIRFDQDFFPYAPTEIFEIESSNIYIKFFMVANHPSGKRAKIYAVNALTGQLEDGIAFYWNGKLVKEPAITIKEWGFLGIGFPNLLDFKNTVGSLRFNGPITFNTISYYQSTNLQEVQQVETRPWISVKTIPPTIFDWEDWNIPNSLWRGVLIKSSTSYYGVDPSTIYESYTGTNKIIIDTDEKIMLNAYEYSVYQDTAWSVTTIKAV